MANRFFRKYNHGLATGLSLDLANADLRVVGIDTAQHDPDTTISGDEFLEDITAGAIQTTTAQLQNVTVVDGVLDADDIALPDTGGNSIEELAVYNHTGDPSTARLLAAIDEATGLPLTPDSVEDSISWPPEGILTL